MQKFRTEKQAPSELQVRSSRYLSQLPNTPDMKMFQSLFASSFRGIKKNYSPSIIRIIAESFASGSLDVAAISSELKREKDNSNPIISIRKLFKKLQKSKKKRTFKISKENAVKVANVLYDLMHNETAKKNLHESINSLPYTDEIRKKLFQYSIEASKKKENGYLYLITDKEEEELDPIKIEPDINKSYDTGNISESEILYFFKLVFENIAPEKIFEQFQKNINKVFFLTDTEQYQQGNIQARISELRNEYKESIGSEFTDSLSEENEESTFLEIDIIQSIIGNFFANLKVFLDEHSEDQKNFDIIEAGFLNITLNSDKELLFLFNGISENTRSLLYKALEEAAFIAMTKKIYNIGLKISWDAGFEEHQITVATEKGEKTIKAKAILSDIDGTLISPAIYPRYLSVLAKSYFFDKDIDTLDINFPEDYSGREINDYVKHLFEINNINGIGANDKKDMLEWLEDEENQKIAYKANLLDTESQSLPIFIENADIFVNSCIQEGMPILPVTNSKRIFIEALDEHFNGVFTQMSMGRTWVCNGEAAGIKPAKDPYIKAMEEYGLKSPEVVALEDSNEGLTSTSRAGIGRERTIVLETGTDINQKFKKLPYKIEHF